MTILERARDNRVTALATMNRRRKTLHVLGKTSAGAQHMRPMLLPAHTRKAATTTNHLRMAA